MSKVYLPTERAALLADIADKEVEYRELMAQGKNLGELKPIRLQIKNLLIQLQEIDKLMSEAKLPSKD